MLVRTLKKISDLGYDIFWLYEAFSNSIIIRVRKGNFVIDQKVDLDFGLYVGGGAGFEFYMDRYLITILSKLEDREKGEGRRK